MVIALIREIPKGVIPVEAGGEVLIGTEVSFR